MKEEGAISDRGSDLGQKAESAARLEIPDSDLPIGYGHAITGEKEKFHQSPATTLGSEAWI